MMAHESSNANASSSTRIDVERVAGAWVELMTSHEICTASRDALKAELSGWTSLLDDGALGDLGAVRELDTLVAVQSRALALEGQPASAAVLKLQLLEEALRATGYEPTATLRARIRWLVRVAADAHVFGVQERVDARHRREIRDFSPVIRGPHGTTIAFLLGEVGDELVESLIGRLLRECAASGSTIAVLDVSGAHGDDAPWLDALAIVLNGELGRHVSAFVVSGLDDPRRCRDDLIRRGVDLGRVRWLPSVSTLLCANDSETVRGKSFA